MTLELIAKKDLICEAICGRLVIEFEYKSEHRVVEPYACGIGKKNSWQLRGFQTSGRSSSGPKLGWRMFSLDEMKELKITATEFSGWEGERRLYNPNDTAFRQFFCRIMR
jgi:hypothetical protein